MKNFFNVKLYLDGIKQLKLIGIMSAIVLSVFSVLIPIGYFVNSMYRDESGQMIFENIIVSMSDITAINHAIYLLIVPVMCLSVFSFLTKRNACDFYHSIPLKRAGLYFSFYASIMTWIIGMLTISSLLSIIAVAFLPNISIITSSVFIFYIKILAASVLVAGGFMIAIGLTGTTFTNLVVAVIILFFPRIFIAATTAMINGTLPYINLSSNGLLLNYHNNLLISFFTGLFGSSYSGVYGPVVYSFILGAVYTAAGCFIFVRRKSEAAGNAAISRWLQLIFRLSVSFIVCLIPCYMIYSMIMDGTVFSNANTTTFFWIVSLYVTALILYFLYELITTKKLKNLVKAMPGVGILALINIIFITCICIGTVFLKRSLPEADDIEYFNICQENDYYDTDNYFSELSSEIKITDPDAIDIIASLLKSTAENSESESDYIYYAANSLDIQIKSGLFKRSYTIALSNNEYSKLIGYLKNNDDFMKLYTELPPLDTNNTTATISCFSQDISDKIYESARREISEMDFQDAYNYLNLDYGFGIDTIEVTTASGIEKYTFEIPVAKTLSKTYALYASEYNRLSSPEFFTDIMNDFIGNSITNDYDTEDILYFYESLNMNINEEIYLDTYYSGEYIEGSFEIYETPDKEQLKLISMLPEHITPVTEDTDVSKADVININYDSYIMTQSAPCDAGYYYTGYFTIDTEGMEIIRRLAAMQGYNLEDSASYADTADVEVFE